MIKKFFLGLILLLLLPTQSSASLLPVGAYVGTRGGIGGNETKTNNGISGSNNPFVSAYAGVRFLKLRGELEYMYRYNAIEFALASGKKESSSKQVMANVYYDFFNFLLVGLYVNGGIGTNKIQTKTVDDYSRNVWSAGIGATVSLVFAQIDLGYRYFDLGNVTVGNNKTKQESHDVYLGLRFGF